MLSYPDIDPVMIHIGPLEVRWYGMMYVFGFTATYLLVRHQIRKFAHDPLAVHFENLNFVLLLGIILGARLGYVFFYNPSYYLSHPLGILATWEGGMSFHGGLIGLILAGFLYCRRHGLNFLRTADIYTVTAPIGLACGRIGNFINGELFGRPAEVPWAMAFPAGGPLPRHPSQLYEGLLEGILLFVILWPLKDRKWPSGSMLAVFLCLYGMVRILAEFFREPDPQLGFFFSFLTMGQLLSSIMIISGATILILNRVKKNLTTQVDRL